MKWQTKKIVEVCEIIAGQSPPGDTYRKQPKGLPFFQGKADFGTRSPVARTWCVAPKKIAERGDILMSVRAPVGPMNIADVQCCIGRGLVAIRSREGTDRDFVHAFLRFHEPKLAELGSGSTFAAINRTDLESIEIPLPPLDEQRRIVGKLDAQMKEVEKMRAVVDAKIAAARALPSSFLRTVFNSPESQTWPVKKLGEVCATDYGFTASSDASIASPKFLRITDIQDGTVEWDDVPGCLIDSQDEAANVLLDGDIVFARTGATTGKSYLVSKPPRAVFASYLIRMRPNRVEVLPEFLAMYFQGDDYWRQIRIGARGGAQPNFNATMLKNLIVPLPPISDQRRIVARLDEQMAHANALIRALESEREAIAALPAALLREVFG